ncbi:MAG: hypothetical protein ACRC1G_21880 [Bradyrhizobium sp.]|nr:hypothetical protein [Bradyrhizobium sp.]
MSDKKDDYTEKEAQARFEAALRGGLNTPHKSLSEKPKVRIKKKNAKKRPGK